MDADARPVALDPLEELMEWLYDQLHQVFDDLYFWIFMQFDGLKLWGYQETAYPVAKELQNLVYASYAVVIVIGGLVAMSHESLQTRYSVKEIAPRMVIGLGLVWASSSVIWWAWLGERKVVQALLDFPEKADHDAFEMFPANEPLDSFDALLAILGEPVAGTKTLLAILQVVLVVVAMLVVLWTAITRVIAWFGVVMTAPVALACHGLPFTEGVARLWWRMLAACVGSSVGQAACVWVWVRLAFDQNGKPHGSAQDEATSALGIDFLLAVIAIWAMWKVHTAAFTWARGRPLRVPGARMIAGIVAWRTMNRVGLGRRRRGNASPRRTPAPARQTTPTAETDTSAVPPPSGWNDGWEPGDQTGGLSPVRGWRPRIDHNAATRAAKRRGAPPKPRFHHNPATLAVRGNGEKAEYARPPQLPSPLRHMPDATPTPTPQGHTGPPPRLRATSEVATRTPSLPRNTGARGRNRKVVRYSSQALHHTSRKETP